MTVRRSLLLSVPVLVLFALGGSLAGAEAPARAPQILEIEVRTSSGSAAQLYWSTDRTFVDERMRSLPLRSGEDFQWLRFALPSTRARWFRFDPTNEPGEVLIRAMRVVDASNTLVEALTPERLHPYQQIASLTNDGAVTRLVTIPGATDASLIFSLSGLTVPIGERIALVTPASLAVVTLAVLLLLIACVALILREAFGPVPGESPATRWRATAWVVALFLIVFSASLLFIRQNPLTVPYWDQWDIEADALYVPYQEGVLTWRSMFSLANEHRVFFTRLLALDLLILNGQWDPRLQQVVNAGMHAMTAVLLVAVAYAANRRRHLDVLVFIAALCFAPPFAWENIVSPIQSASYILVVFTILSLAFVGVYSPTGGAWVLGWACALCAMFTFANGVLVPVAIVGMTFMKWVGGDCGWRELALNGVVAAVAIALGAATASPPLAGHAPLQAASIAAFAAALAHNLSFPWTAQQWAAVFLWLPVIAMLAAALWRRGKTTSLERLLAGVAIWVFLNAVVLAYGRGAGGALPTPRYMDYLSLGVVANAIALLVALDRLRPFPIARRAVMALTVCWLIWVSAGVDHLVRQTQNTIPMWRQFFASHSLNVRRLLVTNDRAGFLALAPLAQLPYPSADRLSLLLQDPYIQRILPPSVRPSLRVEPQASSDGGFALQQVQRGVPYDPLARAWLSLSDLGRGTKGHFESQPLTCRAGKGLRFQVSGYLGWQNQYLAIEEVGSGRRQVITPARTAREGWVDVVLPCPDTRFVVKAIDDSADSWFGFREPVEVGRFFALSEWLIANSRAMLFGSLALAALALRGTGMKSDMAAVVTQS
jgi:hypothetical protein